MPRYGRDAFYSIVHNSVTNERLCALQFALANDIRGIKGPCLLLAGKWWVIVTMQCKDFLTRVQI